MADDGGGDDRADTEDPGERGAGRADRGGALVAVSRIWASGRRGLTGAGGTALMRGRAGPPG